MTSALLEILETERNYVSVLKLISNKFQAPMQKEMQAIEINSKELQQIFGNFNELMQLHVDFLKEMELIFKQDQFSSPQRKILAQDSCIQICNELSDLFVSKQKKMANVYAKYAANCQTALDTIEILKQRKLFKNWWSIVHVDPDLKRLKLDDYLLNPIKRLPLYILLLQAVSKHLSKQTQEHDKMLS